MSDIKETLKKMEKEKKHREFEALKKAVQELNSMPENGDREMLHERADEILCEYLVAIGAKELADAFDNACGRVGFWYA